MKNILKVILLFTFVIISYLYIIYYKEYICVNTILAFKIWLYDLVPILFPSFILSDLIICSKIPYFISNYLHINYIYVISIFCGSPTNAYLIKDYDNKEELLGFSLYPSFIYLYSMLKRIFSVKVTIMLILLNVLSNVILISKFGINIKFKNSNKFNLISSIKNSFFTMINILGSLLFFYVLPIGLINNINIKCFIYSFMEISSSFNYLYNYDINFGFKLLLSIFSISSCGLCINMQIKSIISDTNFKLYFKYRLYHLVIYMILVLLNYYIIFK